MKDEQWLKRMKERLDEYSEPAPLAGWERLEKELARNAAPITPARVPLYRHWRVAAAAAVLLAMSTLALWFLRTPLPHRVGSAVPAAESRIARTDHSREQTLSQPLSHSSDAATSTSTDFVTLSDTENSSDILTSSSDAVISSSDAVTSSSDAVTPSSDAVTSSSDAVVSSSDVVISSSETEEQPAGRSGRSERYRPSGSDKFHVPARTEKGSERRGWSVALALGNTGGFSSEDVNNPALLQQSAVMSPGGRLDLSAISSGLLTIPAGQEVEFRNGIPYLSSNRRLVESAEHKQPVSVGVTVRKELPKGFSVETGLMYTFLSSDIVFAGSSRKEEQNLHYLGIPLRVNWSFLRKNRVELYVSGGGALEKCVYGKLGSEKQTVKPVQLSVSGAVGAQLNLTRRLGVYVEPGVSYYFDDGSSVETVRKENPCNFTLQGGFRLTY